jgi:hypothetical protein
MNEDIDIQGILKLIASIPKGTKLFLRDGVLPGLKLRDFIFEGMGKNGKILLKSEFGGYVWQGKIEVINWERLS